MTLKEQILLDLRDIQNPRMLYQIVDFIALLKRNTITLKSNKAQILALVGILPDEDAKEIRMDIDKEFSTIEGEW